MEKDFVYKEEADRVVVPVPTFRNDGTITSLNKEDILNHLDQMLEYYHQELIKVSDFKEDDKETEKAYYEITGILRGIYLTRDNLDFIEKGIKKIKVKAKKEVQPQLDV